jgi:hypothetical protein
LTILADSTDPALPEASENGWEDVIVPHNWEDYHGYHQVSHSNLHGTAWYRTTFDHCPEPDRSGDRLYAFFEGVGSYATVYLNGHEAGTHAGGRTTFTIDLTEYLVTGSNVLTVKAEHPEKIDDLPFVCGGCWGSPNTEGSQPLGIFRPVWLEQTGAVRVEPFGVHVLTPLVSEKKARVQTRTTLLNPGTDARTVTVRQTIVDADGVVVARGEKNVYLPPQAEETVTITFPEWESPQLWSPDSPALHTVQTEVSIDGDVSHAMKTRFGLRWIEWPSIDAPDADHNVVSADRRGALVSLGNDTRTPENNGLTVIQHAAPERPVHLAPMGVIVRQTEHTTLEVAHLRVDLQLAGSLPEGQPVKIFCEILNEGGTVFFHQYRQELRVPAAGLSHQWEVPPVNYPHRWSERDPYLHSVVVEIWTLDGIMLEKSETLFGIRLPNWDPAAPLNLARPVYAALPERDKTVHSDKAHDRVLKLNGEPLFLRGTCEYETLLGCDHAFTDEQIAADVKMMKAAGFNAFRDAHHPHNLRYYDHWDEAGIACWTQMGSHIWFDNERFRQNSRQLVREWVKERRNHPCILIWGLQNESAMPEAFATELRDIVREMDPTSPQWRITTTCNGGKGSDWNVPQDWSGTYGGSCHDYDLRTAQLVGEYGAWRNFGVHTETEYSGNENDRSESWACAAMETKLRIGEESRDSAIGHFHWVYNTFPNPGRSPDNVEGPGDAEIGSVNNKGLVTAWHQPSDLYYMFRSNYRPGRRDPMVYIASHTWPNRWAQPSPRKVRVYSNCEEVELFNGVGRRSYGRKRHASIGRHFAWEDVLPETNLLYAAGYIHGIKVAEDLIRLDHLPEDESLSEWIGSPRPTPPPDKGTALFRVNCGSSRTYEDADGGCWSADTPWSDSSAYGWESWGNRFANVRDDLASQGYTMTPVRGTNLQGLYREYRYGRQYLKYHFRCGTGRFLVRCHFAEPWFGVGGFNDAAGLRVFDVAVNGQTVDRALDIHEVSGGHHRALVREYIVEQDCEVLTLHFPRIQVNQALIFGIECIRLDIQ